MMGLFASIGLFILKKARIMISISRIVCYALPAILLAVAEPSINDFGKLLGHLQAVQEQAKVQEASPLAAIMHDVVSDLQSHGVDVRYPPSLPTLLRCSECLDRGNHFGAYNAELNQVTVRDDIDITSPQGRAELMHEFGHVLLSQYGMEASKQEYFCLRLGNSSYRFASNVEKTE